MASCLKVNSDGVVGVQTLLTCRQYNPVKSNYPVSACVSIRLWPGCIVHTERDRKKHLLRLYKTEEYKMSQETWLHQLVLGHLVLFWFGEIL